MIANIFWLGTKELRSFLRDYVLLAFVIYAFSLQIMAQANSYSQEVHNAAVAAVDEDHSELSERITRAFLPPYFKPAQPIAERDIVPLMNLGKYTFVIDIPPNFERDVLRGRDPAVQLNVDATVMVQAGLGTGYAQEIITNEINDFMSRAEGAPLSSVNLDVRVLFNPSQVHQRDGNYQQHQHARNYSGRSRRRAGAGARDHGSSPGDAVDTVRDSDVEGLGERFGDYSGRRIFALSRRPRLAACPHCGLDTALHPRRDDLSVFACAVGIFLGTVARSMPQLGLLYMLVYLPMNVLSGSNTPLESMPPWLANAMQASPSTHFVSFAQSILYRGAGIDVVWLQFLLVAGIGSLFFLLAILRFRSTASQIV